MQRILITGATGFVGRNLVRYFLTSGRDVQALSRRKSVVVDGVRTVLYDNADPKSLNRALFEAKPDVVVHVAGLVNGPPAAIEAANVGFTEHLLEAIEAADLKPDICFVSTVSAIEKAGVYGEAKRHAEDLIARHAPARWIVLRPSLIHGPGAVTNVGTLIRAVRYWPVIPVVGRSAVRLQPLYTDDLAQAIEAFVCGRGQSGKRYVVSGPRQELLVDMIRMIQERIGRKAPLVPVPLGPVKLAIGAVACVLPFLGLPVQQVKALKCHPMYRWDAAAADLGFDPRTFDETIALYL